MKKLRLLRITTVPVSLHVLLKGQLTFMQQQGIEVLAVSSDGKEVEAIRREGIEHKVVEMTRRITPFKDLGALRNLIRLIREFKPDIIHSHTPKAGLLAMMASWWCGVPVRIHTVAGLPLMESRGMKRQLLILTERMTYAFATHVMPNSTGLTLAIHDTIGRSKKLYMIGRGSSNGIDTSYFARTHELQLNAKDIRTQHLVKEGEIVFCFVGRIVRDKGIHELIEAFRSFCDSHPARLLLLGDFESHGNEPDQGVVDFIRTDPRVIYAGFQSDIRPWLLAADIFVLPSYREGFPQSVMQAAALEMPIIVTDINGCNEVVGHQVTGLLVKPKDVASLGDAMRWMAEHPEERRIFGERARAFMVSNFEQRTVWQKLLNHYQEWHG